MGVWSISLAFLIGPFCFLLSSTAVTSMTLERFEKALAEEVAMGIEAELSNFLNNFFQSLNVDESTLQNEHFPKTYLENFGSFRNGRKKTRRSKRRIQRISAGSDFVGFSDNNVDPLRGLLTEWMAQEASKNSGFSIPYGMENVMAHLSRRIRNR